MASSGSRCAVARHWRGWRLAGALHAKPRPLSAGDVELQGLAIASHLVYGTDRRHPIEVAASEPDYLAQWLSNRLNRTVMPPDLSRFGYTLIGGRLLATEQGNAAALFI
jgi:anti-sigma factor RsiW